MKKTAYFFPAMFALLIYTALLFVIPFTSIHPIVWICIASLFASAILMDKGKWFGCIGGILIGCIVIYKGSIDTGQIFNETPIGIALCIYYLICGIMIMKNRQNKND